MAVVQLSDVIQPEFFAQYSAENSMTSTALFRSGVLVPNPLMRAQLGQGGDTLNIPFWLDLVSPADPSGVEPFRLGAIEKQPENLRNQGPCHTSLEYLLAFASAKVGAVARKKSCVLKPALNPTRPSLRSGSRDEWRRFRRTPNHCSRVGFVPDKYSEKREANARFTSCAPACPFSAVMMVCFMMRTDL